MQENITRQIEVVWFQFDEFFKIFFKYEKLRQIDLVFRCLQNECCDLTNLISN